jgi:hypothetical protein
LGDNRSSSESSSGNDERSEAEVGSKGSTTTNVVC